MRLFQGFVVFYAFGAIIMYALYSYLKHSDAVRASKERCLAHADPSQQRALSRAEEKRICDEWSREEFW